MSNTKTQVIKEINANTKDYVALVPLHFTPDDKGLLQRVIEVDHDGINLNNGVIVCLKKHAASIRKKHNWNTYDIVSVPDDAFFCEGYDIWNFSKVYVKIPPPQKTTDSEHVSSSLTQQFVNFESLVCTSLVVVFGLIAIKN